ncbi:MAG: protein kinase domain-containing protein [Planctomyces sp.]
MAEATTLGTGFRETDRDSQPVRPGSSELNSEINSVEQLIVQWQEYRDEGQEVTPEEICENRPEYLSTFVRQLCDFQNMEARFADAFADSTDSGIGETPEIPDYQIIRCLGRGGMGVVYLAFHTSLRREVALKVMLPGSSSETSRRNRFITEATSIARLNHPNIVQIHDVGQCDGRLYFAMEYCSAGSLDDQLTGIPLPAITAASLCETLSRAVQHAHDRGIIHRDLKPGNVVLQPGTSGDGEFKIHSGLSTIPKISDFGLARQLEEDRQTKSDAVLGTPSYMSPEQARGSVDITRLSDVYSLGAILYELLTGRPPFRASSVLETIGQVLNSDPVPPIQLHSDLPRDINTICLKALQKDPARRYQSAGELADDLRRFQHGLSIHARPASAVERLYRWGRRNPGWAATILTIWILLTVSAGLSWKNITESEISLRRIQAEQKRTLAEEEKTRAALSTAKRTLYLASIRHAETAWQDAQSVTAQESLQQCPEELRDWEWHFLHELCESSNHGWTNEDGEIQSIACDPASRSVAVCLADGTLIVRHLDTGTQKHRLASGAAGRHRMSFLNHGKQLVYTELRMPTLPFMALRSRLVIQNSDEGGETTFSWDAPPGSVIYDLAFAETTGVLAVSYGSDAGNSPSQVQYFSVVNGTAESREQMSLPSAGCRQIAISADGLQLAAAGGDSSAYILDRKSGQILTELEVFADSDGSKNRFVPRRVTMAGKTMLLIEKGVDSLEFSQDGRLLAAGLSSGQVRVWNTSERSVRNIFSCDREHVVEIAFSPDGNLLAAASLTGGSIYLFDVNNGEPVQRLQGHSDRVSGLVFSDANMLLSASYDQSIRKWNLQDRNYGRIYRGHQRSVFASTMSPDGTTLVTGDGDLFQEARGGTILWRDLNTREVTRKIDLESGGVGSLVYSPCGQHLAAGCGDGLVRIWKNNDDQPSVLSGHASAVRAIAWAPHGQNSLVSVSGSLPLAFLPGEAIVWNTETREERFRLKGHTAALSSVAWSHDGRTIITASADRTVRIWNADDGTLLRTLTGASEPVLSLAVDPKGRWIAGGTGNLTSLTQQTPGEIIVWDTETGKVSRTLRGHNQLVNGLSVTPNGERLVSCSRNDKIRFWDPMTGIEILNLPPHDYACGVAFTADGTRLLVPAWDGSVELYTADTWRMKRNGSSRSDTAELLTTWTPNHR